MGCASSFHSPEGSGDDLTNATYENTPVYYPAFTKAKCIKVYDGDTFHVACTVDGKVQRFMIRAYGYDSPEIRSRNAVEKLAGLTAKKFLQKRIEGKIINVNIIREKEKFGRILATISDAEGDINKWMI